MEDLEGYLQRKGEEEQLNEQKNAVLNFTKTQSKLSAIQKNLEDLNIEAHVLEVKVESLLNKVPSNKLISPFQLVFLDPPYEYSLQEISKVLNLGLSNSWFSQDAILVIETGKGIKEFIWPEGFESVREKSYGDTSVWYGQVCKK